MKTLSLLPLVCYVVLASFAVYASSVVGHWPYYSHPDPKDLPLGHLTPVFSLSALLGLVSVALLPLVYAIYRVVAAWEKWPVQHGMAPYVVYVAGAMLWINDFIMDRFSRHSLLAWIFD